MYQYKAKIVNVYDGDTVTAEVDLGFKIHFTEKFRLFGINAPELRGKEKEEGKKSRDRLKELILNETVIIRTIKDKKGKYGRYLAVIYLDGVEINKQLVEEGFAQIKYY